jgi:hypothetical protein
MFGKSFSRKSYRPPVHQTRTGRYNRTQAATRRQNATRRSVYGRTFRNGSRNRNGSVKKSFMGGFFEKFASEIKKL